MIKGYKNKNKNKNDFLFLLECRNKERIFTNRDRCMYNGLKACACVKFSLKKNSSILYIFLYHEEGPAFIAFTRKILGCHCSW